MTKPKSALVTGASRGIGFGVALRLAQEGIQTAIVGRDRTRIEQASKKITDITGTQTLAIVGDVAIYSDCLSAVEKVVKEFGSINVLVPNAGVGIIGSVDESDPADWALMMQTNYLGTAHIVKAVLPVMQKQASGRSWDLWIVLRKKLLLKEFVFPHSALVELIPLFGMISIKILIVQVQKGAASS